MTLEQAILEKVRSLPPEKQQEILEFAEFLERKSMTFKSVQTSEKVERSLADFYGICFDDPIVVDDKFVIDHGGVCSALDDDMEGAFD